MHAESSIDEATSRIEQFDFDRLEQSVEFLIKEHQRLSSEHEELLAELINRERRISSLERRLDTEQGQRATAVKGVDRILARLEQLQTSAKAAARGAS